MYIFTYIFENILENLIYESAGIWLYTRPQIDQPWYNKLRQIASLDKVVQNLNLAVDGISNDERCLILKANLNLDPSFKLESIKCNEKRSVICRKTNDKMIQRFPCIPQTQPDGNKQNDISQKRRKRSLVGMRV